MSNTFVPVFVNLC